MTLSMGRVVVPSFRLHGKLIHRVGSLLPQEGQGSCLCSAVCNDNALQAHEYCAANAWNFTLDHGTLHELQDML